MFMAIMSYLLAECNIKNPTIRIYSYFAYGIIDAEIKFLTNE